MRAGEGQWSGRYHRAHLRNRRGYLELCWRDGERVRSFYLGKAAKKFPTPAIAHQVDQLAGGAGRRGKKVESDAGGVFHRPTGFRSTVRGAEVYDARGATERRAGGTEIGPTPLPKGFVTTGRKQGKKVGRPLAGG